MLTVKYSVVHLHYPNKICRFRTDFEPPSQPSDYDPSFFRRVFGSEWSSVDEPITVKDAVRKDAVQPVADLFSENNGRKSNTKDVEPEAIDKTKTVSKMHILPVINTQLDLELWRVAY